MSPCGSRAGSRRPRIAVFRPDDGRLDAARDLLESLGADPVPDPMLEVEPTGDRPRTDTEYVVFTSKTGVELAAGERRDEGGPDERWEQGDATVCAIGDTTAAALRDAGYAVDVVPEEFSSAGLVEALGEAVDGKRVEVARSDHGSAVLLDGLEAAGAYVHETALYRLARPDGAGESAELAAEGVLDGVLFTSSLTVRNFLSAAADRGVREDAVAGLEEAVVGVIGDPTARTAEREGVDADVVPGAADFEALAEAAVDEA